MGIEVNLSANAVPYADITCASMDRLYFGAYFGDIIAKVEEIIRIFSFRGMRKLSIEVPF